MGHVKKKESEVTYSDSKFKFNPSYEELQVYNKLYKKCMVKL